MNGFTKATKSAESQSWAIVLMENGVSHSVVLPGQLFWL